jgi:hypothetical protein
MNELAGRCALPSEISVARRDTAPGNAGPALKERWIIGPFDPGGSPGPPGRLKLPGPRRLIWLSITARLWMLAKMKLCCGGRT